MKVLQGPWDKFFAELAYFRAGIFPTIRAGRGCLQAGPGRGDRPRGIKKGRLPGKLIALESPLYTR